MKVGDKIRFLNAIGGGIVKSFRGKDIVLVEDQDGFEIPVLIRECIVIEPQNETQVRQSVKPNETVSVVESNRVAPQVKREIEEIEGGDRITVCLAYLPIDRKSLNTTGYECYLVNDSNYYLSFNYMSRSDLGWTSRFSGVVEPNTKLFIEEFEKSTLNDMERVCLQYISYKQDKPYKIKNPCSVELRIDTVKFYKLHSFRENDYFDDEALLYYVMRRDLPEKEFVVSVEDLEMAMHEKAKSDRRPRVQPIVKKQTSGILEIDLHANSLLDTTLGMSSGDLLEYQLSKFREVMEENKSKKGQQIVFIHGKGDGVLKNSIIKELKHKFKSVYYQDASFREYGFGATMVTIR